MKYISLMFIIIFAFSCSCKKNIKTVEDDENKASKITNTNKKPIRKYNSTKDFILVINKKDIRKNDIFPTIFYSVVDVKSKKIIYKDIVPGGEVEWFSDYVISVKSLLIRPKDIHASTTNLLYKLNIKTLKRFK